jgi:hypothetical protein
MNVQWHACFGGTCIGEDIRKLEYGQHVESGTLRHDPQEESEDEEHQDAGSRQSGRTLKQGLQGPDI